MDKIKFGLKPTDPVTALAGVGENRAKLYKKLGVENIDSLIRFYPRDYLDLSNPISIEDSELDQVCVIKATVVSHKSAMTIRRGLSIFKLLVTDGQSNMIITIFNSKYQYDELKDDVEYYFCGKVTGTSLRREMTSPTFLEATIDCTLRPIYSLTAGLSNKMVQNQVKDCLELLGDRLTDTLNDEIKQRYKLAHLRYAFTNAHFPKDRNALEVARARLIFEELLILQLGLIILRRRNRSSTGVPLSKLDVSEFYTALPFTLTGGQQTAIEESLSDMKGGIPMNRLCQGDVGCGKTMVAFALCFACHKNGYQSAIMAPTQILAEQHYANASALLEPMGIRVALLKGAQSKTERQAILDGIKSGEISLVIGTQALAVEGVEFKSLALVVTDEQHRFGVAQRASLVKKGDNPHLLVMSATPIPRTLALIIYGDLDVSQIKELPQGRQPVETHCINGKIRARSLGFVKKNIDEGRQAYIVCPLIEENESDLVSVQEYIEALKQTPLGSYRIEALNGRLKSAEKEGIMRRFKAGEIDILVSTTVVEVGVDVPNASIMVVENAERFGLSQLHQLRGRVGRGKHKSYCILISDNKGEENQKRLKVMASISDGFLIANEDLKLRGPGDFFGFRQHGLPELRIANLVNDMDILKETTRLANEILGEDAELDAPQNAGLKKAVSALFDRNGQESFS